MKKLFARLMLWFIALTNNLSFCYSGDYPFQTNDSYYNGQNHNDIDYQELYNSFVEDENTVDGCKLTRRVPEGGLSRTYKGLQGPYWVVYNDSDGEKMCADTGKADSLKLECKDKDLLIAPSNCTIKTDASKSQHGTYMQITIGTGDVVITFDQMERWYCCLERKDSSRNDDGTFTHTKNAYGKQLQAGDILGYATENTTITITKNGSVISLAEFFNGKK